MDRAAEPATGGEPSETVVTSPAVTPAITIPHRPPHSPQPLHRPTPPAVPRSPPPTHPPLHPHEPHPRLDEIPPQTRRHRDGVHQDVDETRRALGNERLGQLDRGAVARGRAEDDGHPVRARAVAVGEGVGEGEAEGEVREEVIPGGDRDGVGWWARCLRGDGEGGSLITVSI